MRISVWEARRFDEKRLPHRQLLYGCLNSSKLAKEESLRGPSVWLSEETRRLAQLWGGSSPRLPSRSLVLLGHVHANRTTLTLLLYNEVSLSKRERSGS